MKKVFVVGYAKQYARWINNHELTDNLEEADIVLFTGGEDVDPSLYGCEKHPTTYSNLKRDLEEKEVFEKVKPHQLCVGICRGSQFLCVMNGGLLIQNVDNHASFGTHSISRFRDEFTRYEITSTHHQMQYPYNLTHGDDYELLYHANPKRSHYYEGDKIIEVPYEAEIVLYHVKNKPRCLAIQGHPEMMRAEAPVIKMLNNLIERYVR